AGLTRKFWPTVWAMQAQFSPFCTISQKYYGYKHTKRPLPYGRGRKAFPSQERELLLDLGDNAGADGVAAFADSEAHAFFHGNRGDQLNMHIDVVAGHAHLGALGQGDDAGNVGGAEVELRTIVVEERGVTAALFLLQDIDMAVEGGVGMNGAGNSDDLAALDLVAVDTTQQGADVVAGLSEVQALAEHLQTGDGGGHLLFLQADDLHLVADMGSAALDTA